VAPSAGRKKKQRHFVRADSVESEVLIVGDTVLVLWSRTTLDWGRGCAWLLCFRTHTIRKLVFGCGVLPSWSRFVISSVLFFSFFPTFFGMFGGDVCSGFWEGFSLLVGVSIWTSVWIIFPGLPAPVAVTSVFWVCGDGKSAGGVPTSETCMILTKKRAGRWLFWPKIWLRVPSASVSISTIV